MPDVAVVMPKLSMTMTEGEVVAWRRSSGEAVQAGDVVAEVLTDKVEMEVEAPATGVLSRLVAEEGDRIAVGEPLAYITSESEGLLDGLMGSDSDSAAEISSPTGDNAADTVERDGSPETAQIATPPSRKAGQPALPGARRRAGELGIALSDLTGSGPDGVVTKRDVDAAAARTHNGRTDAPAADAATPDTATPDTATPDTATPDTATPDPRPTAATPSAREASEPPGADANPAFDDALHARRAQIRAAVAEVMQRSAVIPQFTVFRLLELDLLDRHRGRCSWTTVITAMLARALRDNEALGGPGIDVALAVDTPVGLLAPVVRDADTLGLPELDAAIRAAAQRARSGRLRRADIAGGSTTVSNLGSWDVESFTALLTPPQASALSVGAVAPQPVLRGGGIAITLACRVGLTVDHRVADGADAARLLAHMARLCAEPGWAAGDRG